MAALVAARALAARAVHRPAHCRCSLGLPWSGTQAARSQASCSRSRSLQCSRAGVVRSLVRGPYYGPPSRIERDDVARLQPVAVLLACLEIRLCKLLIAAGHKMLNAAALDADHELHEEVQLQPFHGDHSALISSAALRHLARESGPYHVL